MEGDLVSTHLLEHRGAWTVAELATLPEELKVELIDGTLIVNPRPAPLHQIVAMNLGSLLNERLGPTWIAAPDVMLRVGTDTALAPDVVLLRRELTNLRETCLRPEWTVLAVEVVSPSSRSHDRLIKPHLYAGAGIPGFWRIETEPELALTAYVLRVGEYAEVGAWRAGETVLVDEPVEISFAVSDLMP